MSSPQQELFLDSPIGQRITQATLDLELKQANNWQERYRMLMKLGERMPKLSPELKQIDFEVSGCESKTWLHHHQTTNEKHFFLADSEARIVRGLIVLVLAAYNGKTSDELKAIDLSGWFDDLGLSAHLSPSRANGLNAVIKAIITR